VTMADRERDNSSPLKERKDGSSGHWPVARRVPSGMRDAGPASNPGYSSDLGPLIKVLERYLSTVNAKLLLERTLRERNLTLETFTAADLRKVGGALRRGIQLFVNDDRRTQALQEVAALCGSDSLMPEPTSTAVVSEGDIVTACNHARQVCDTAGATSFAMHKVMTIVSELGRNMISYAGGGRIELTVVRAPTKRIVARAIDTGPGIGNLQEILSGKYRSKTGLGKGLIGTKRLADRFDISTGAAGTVVVVEIVLRASTSPITRLRSPESTPTATLCSSVARRATCSLRSSTASDMARWLPKLRKRRSPGSGRRLSSIPS
jgi:serine/threonine-protein kinase RsbT